MKTSLRITLAQLNLSVGDIKTNLQKHIDAANRACEQKADLIVFPELSITGYPPEDLLYRQSFLTASDQALKEMIKNIKNIYCLVSHPLKNNNELLNACTLFYNGKIIAQYAKQNLPNYSVFDEDRYFTPGTQSCIADIHGIPVGLLICEDLWTTAPAAALRAQGAKIIVAPNASPFEVNKHANRLEILTKRAKETRLPIVYVNNIGGQDEIVFDGDSMVINADAQLSAQGPLFEEALITVDINTNGAVTCIDTINTSLEESDEALIYHALVLGLRDYVNKNGFSSVLLGLSGGIDSALTLAIAYDALGKDRVQVLIMPSRHTADFSVADAVALAEILGVRYDNISIEPAYEAFINSLQKRFSGKAINLTEENIQARCRAILLMAVSNKEGPLVLTTGNRSEYAVGYCTLYGDMAGGFAVLKDVLKTMVYRLARYRNRIATVIPQRTIDRPPSAELAPDQKDEDSLPPYSMLDKILENYLDKELSVSEIIQQGFDAEVVNKVVNLIRGSEYKRSQAAIGPRINLKSFGKDRRYPITNGFKESASK